MDERVWWSNFLTVKKCLDKTSALRNTNTDWKFSSFLKTQIILLAWFNCTVQLPHGKYSAAKNGIGKPI